MQWSGQKALLVRADAGIKPRHWLWLINPLNRKAERTADFQRVKENYLKEAVRAWEIKKLLAKLRGCGRKNEPKPFRAVVLGDKPLQFQTTTQRDAEAETSS